MRAWAAAMRKSHGNASASPFRGATSPAKPRTPLAMKTTPAVKEISSTMYRPRLVGHRLEAYAARAAAESCSFLIAAGGRKPCRSISQVAL